MAATAATACALHQAYPGDPRPIDQLAVVVTAFEKGYEIGSRIEQVVLHGISGVACPDSPCIGSTTYAQLLPGSYDFDVGFDTMHQGVTIPFANLFLLGDDAIDAVKNRRLTKRIRFSVEAGKTYEIYVDPKTATYFVYVLNGVAEVPDRPGMHPPPGAEPCVASTGETAPSCEIAR